jgi:hypothetical protein
MTSEREAAANRLNARKSRGPRTAGGKATASRNALRHGLAALVHKHPVLSAEIESFAEALCDGDNDPTLFAQALIIGRNELVLRAISAQQIGVVERLADPSAIALAKGDNSLKLSKAHLWKCKRAFKELIALRDHLMEKYKDELPPPTEVERVQEARGGYPFFPPRLSSFLWDKEDLAANEPGDSAQVASALQEPPDRDEGAALEEAARDLIRLDRYERRAWSQQKRTILEFMNIKLVKGIAATNGGSAYVAGEPPAAR